MRLLAFFAIIACTSALVYRRRDFEDDERYRLPDPAIGTVLSDSVVRAALDAYFNQKRAGGKFVIHGSVSVAGTPTIPAGSCMKVTLWRKGGLLGPHLVHVPQKTVVYNLDQTDANSLRYLMTIRPVSEVNMVQWNSLTAVLNMGYCGDGRSAAKKGDYETAKRKSVYFEVGFDDYPVNLMLVKKE